MCDSDPCNHLIDNMPCSESSISSICCVAVEDAVFDSLAGALRRTHPVQSGLAPWADFCSSVGNSTYLLLNPRCQLFLINTPCPRPRSAFPPSFQFLPVRLHHVPTNSKISAPQVRHATCSILRPETISWKRDRAKRPFPRHLRLPNMTD